MGEITVFGKHKGALDIPPIYVFLLMCMQLKYKENAFYMLICTKYHYKMSMYTKQFSRIITSQKWQRGKKAAKKVDVCLFTTKQL